MAVADESASAPRARARARAPREPVVEATPLGRDLPLLRRSFRACGAHDGPRRAARARRPVDAAATSCPRARIATTRRSTRCHGSGRATRELRRLVPVHQRLPGALLAGRGHLPLPEACGGLLEVAHDVDALPAAQRRRRGCSSSTSACDANTLALRLRRLGQEGVGAARCSTTRTSCRCTRAARTSSGPSATASSSASPTCGSSSAATRTPARSRTSA